MPDLFLYIKQFYFKQFNLGLVHSSVLFDSLIRPYQVLPLRPRMDLGAMAMRRYSAFTKAPALENYWNLNIRLSNVIARRFIWGVFPFCRESVGVFSCPSRLGKEIQWVCLKIVSIREEYINLTDSTKFSDFLSPPVPIIDFLGLLDCIHYLLWWIWVFAKRPTVACPYVGVHKGMSLISPAVLCMSCMSYLDCLWDGGLVVV